MSLLSVLRIRELYHRIAVFLPSTDAYNLSQAVGQPFMGYEKHLLHAWRDYFTTLSWPNCIIKILEGLGFDAEVLIVGPRMLLSKHLSTKRNYSTDRKDLTNLKLPFLNVYIVIDNAPYLSPKAIYALERQLMMLIYHLDCVEDIYLPGDRNMGIGVITLTTWAPLVRYCVPGEKKDSLRPIRPSSRRKLKDPPSMECIIATKHGIKFSRAQKVNCYCPNDRNIYLTVGGYRGDRVRYATYKITRVLLT